MTMVRRKVWYGLPWILAARTQAQPFIAAGLRAHDVSVHAAACSRIVTRSERFRGRGLYANSRADLPTGRRRPRSRRGRGRRDPRLGGQACPCEGGGALPGTGDQHGASRRRSWQKLHIGVDAVSGEIVTVEATETAIDDGAMVDALLVQIADPIASLTADGDYDHHRVYQAVTEHYPDTAVIMPTRGTAVLYLLARALTEPREIS